MSHTPGPWVWNEERKQIETVALYPEYDGSNYMIPRAIVETDSGFYAPFGDDCYLLAAAPEMFEVLQWIVDSNVIASPEVIKRAKMVLAIASHSMDIGVEDA